MFSFLSPEEIQEIVSNHNNAPEKRNWQKILAATVVEMVHGKIQAEVSMKISEFLFWSEDKTELLKNLNSDEFEIFAQEIGVLDYKSQNLFEILIESELEKSGGTARQSIKSGAIYINENKIEDANYDFSNDFIDGKFLLLRKGKKNYRIIKK